MTKIIKKTVYCLDDFELNFEPIEDTIKIKKVKNGYEIKYLTPDTMPDNPRNWGNLGKMICFHRRYDLGDKHEYSIEDIKELVKRQDVIALPLYLYDHSGISMKTYPFGIHKNWDCGQIGYIFVDYDTIKKEYGKVNKKTKEQARKVLLAEVETFDMYIKGDTYNIVREDFNNKKEHKNYDIVGGFFGYEDSLKALETEI
jgi:hypothetical protein